MMWCYFLSVNWSRELCRLVAHLHTCVNNLHKLVAHLHKVYCIFFFRGGGKINILFSSPDPMGHVRYCHHLASVVRPLTFHILIYSSETSGPNGTKLVRKHLYKVLYKVSSFRPIPPTNIATKGNSCFLMEKCKF